MAEEATKQETTQSLTQNDLKKEGLRLPEDIKKDASKESQKATLDSRKSEKSNENRPRRSSLKKGSQTGPEKDVPQESGLQETFHDAEEQDTGALNPEKEIHANGLKSHPTPGGDGHSRDEYTIEDVTNKHDLFAGDDIIPDAAMVYDQKRTIRASAEEIFPWLRQLGKGRGGWYLPLRMEALLPQKWRPARQIEPRWQKLTRGERLADYGFSKKDYFVVERVEEPHTIVLRSHRYGCESTWALLLRELHDSAADPEPATVVHLRFRGKLKAQGVKRKVMVQGCQLLDRISTVPLLMGLAERTERGKNTNVDKLHDE